MTGGIAAAPALVVAFDGVRRCLSSAVLGGGLRDAAAFLNLQVAHGYSRLDPAAHLAQECAARALDDAATIGMLTAADVGAATHGRDGCARVVATVGLGQALAAAGRRPRLVRAVGTVNVLVLVDAPLDDAALVGAVQTAVEAKAQALADARIPARNHTGWATGTPTDSICIAAMPGASVAFAGPATETGAAIARAVHAAVHAGAVADRACRPLNARATP